MEHTVRIVEAGAYALSGRCTVTKGTLLHLLGIALLGMTGHLEVED